MFFVLVLRRAFANAAVKQQEVKSDKKKMRLVRTLVDGYTRLLHHHPRVVVGTQSGLLMAAGDFLAQTCVEGVPLREVDPSRVVRFGVIGAFIAGPGLKIWFSTLDKFIGREMTVKKALLKTFVDQGVLAPPMLAAVIGTVQYTKHRDVDRTLNFCKYHGWEILKMNWMLWPGVQMVNFYYVPLPYRLLLAQTFALFWNVYLATKANRVNDVDWNTSPEPPSSPSSSTSASCLPTLSAADSWSSCSSVSSPSNSSAPEAAYKPFISFAEKEGDDEFAGNESESLASARPPSPSDYLGVSHLFSEFSLC